MYKRFWNKIRVTKGCWLWTGCTRGSKEYGAIRFKSKLYRAHRFSWIIHYGPIPEGILVLHTCDNPLCVNPNHLFLGTHEDNIEDCKNKGRLNRPKGEQNGRSKLSYEDVLLIKRRLKEGIKQNILAKEFNISQQTISNIKLNQSWN